MHRIPLDINLFLCHRLFEDFLSEIVLYVRSLCWTNIWGQSSSRGHLIPKSLQLQLFYIWRGVSSRTHDPGWVKSARISISKRFLKFYSLCFLICRGMGSQNTWCWLHDFDPFLLSGLLELFHIDSKRWFNFCLGFLRLRLLWLLAIGLNWHLAWILL